MLAVVAGSPEDGVALAYARSSTASMHVEEGWMPGTSSAKTRFALLPGHDIEMEALG